MSDYGIFESIEGSSSEKKIATRQTQRKLDAAIDDVKNQYGSFLYASRDTEEWNDRVALCKDDMIRTVNAHLMPVTGVMRRIVKACKDEWRIKHADKTGPAMDNDQIFSPKKDKDLKPKGDFDAYLNKVDQNSDAAVDNCFKESRYYYAENGVGAAPSEPEPAGMNGGGMDPVAQASATPVSIPGIQAARYFTAKDPSGYIGLLQDDEEGKGPLAGGSFGDWVKGVGAGLGLTNRDNVIEPNAPKAKTDDGKLRLNPNGPGESSGTPDKGSFSINTADPSKASLNPNGPDNVPSMQGKGGTPAPKGKADGSMSMNTNGPASVSGTVGQGGSYTVKPGDTLSGIAKSQGISDYRDIVKNNPGNIGTSGTNIQQNENLIHPGDVLNTSKSSTPAAPAAASAPAAATKPGVQSGSVGGKLGSLAVDQYIDWCDSFGYRRASVNNLDIYAQNLNDRAYFEIASAITDPSSPIYRTAAPGAGGGSAPQSGPGTGASAPAPQDGILNPGWIQNIFQPGHTESGPSYVPVMQQTQGVPASQMQHVLNNGHYGNMLGGPGKSSVEEDGPTAGGYEVDPDYLKDELGRRRVPKGLGGPGKSRGASIHTAAPDYLQKADEALTNLLNQRAEEFQQTIAPLQQALQTVQQAEALQQAQNPMGVQPPAGTVNVLPGQGDSGGGGDAGGDPMAAAQALAGMGGGGGMPPGGGDPSMGGGGMDPSQMQMQARRKRQAKGGFSHGDIVTHAGGDPRAVVPTEGGNPGLRGIIVGKPVVLNTGKPGHLVNWEGEGHPMFGQFGGGGSYHHPEELVATGERQEINPDGSDPRVKPWPYGDYGREAKRGGQGKARGAKRPIQADVAGDFTKWMGTRGPGAVQNVTDAQSFSEAQGYKQRGMNSLQSHNGPDALVDAATPKKKNKMPGTVAPTMPKAPKGAPRTASFFTRKVAGWQWDDHLNGYLANKPTPFTCKCGSKHSVPSYSTCRCGKIWNSYVIGTGGDRHQAAVEKFICREIPVRDGVIVANKRNAQIGVDYDDTPYWAAAWDDEDDEDDDWPKPHKKSAANGLNVTQSAPPKDKPVVLMYGGAFNPPHQGHVGALSDAHKALSEAGYKVDGSIVVPTADKLLAKKGLGELHLPLPSRAKITRAAFPPDINGAPVNVATEPSEEVERSPQKPRRSDLARWAQQHYPNHTIVNVTGEDAVVPGAPMGQHPSLYSGEIGSAHEGVSYLTLPRPEGSMSSSAIRAALQAGQRIPGMTPEAERAYREELARNSSRQARRKKADCNCWKGYERVPGTKPCAPGSCRKCDSHSKKESGKVKRHNLSDPGPLGEGKDDKMPDISEDLGKKWYQHGPGGKFVGNG